MTPDLCRPFSKNRNGMVLGAGGAVIVLESEEHARKRGATILAELAGYGTTTDAKDPVAPDVNGAARAMREALADAGVEPDAIDYVNAHGTATVVNDATESAALGDDLRRARWPRVPVSSTKAVHGHGLGAAGALEMVVTLGAMRESIAPPTINYEVPDEKCPVDAIPNVARSPWRSAPPCPTPSPSAASTPSWSCARRRDTARCYSPCARSRPRSHAFSRRHRPSRRVIRRAGDLPDALAGRSRGPRRAARDGRRTGSRCQCTSLSFSITLAPLTSWSALSKCASTRAARRGLIAWFSTGTFIAAERWRESTCASRRSCGCSRTAAVAA